MTTATPTNVSPSDPPSEQQQPDEGAQIESGHDRDPHDEPDLPILNTVKDLAKGIVHSTEGKISYTILVVGETGTGKTTVLSLLANILKGNTPAQYEKFYDGSNEAGGSSKHSQTNSAKLYEFTSRNGVIVRILDTPGLADTRGIAQDELHKQSIAMAIQEHITTVTAVLILANGTVPRLGVATDYALTTLSSIFPRTLANNIGFIFTNVSSPLSWNFDDESLPDILRDNSQYLLDNPVAMQEKLIRENDKQIARGKRNLVLMELFHQSVKEGHTKALGMLVSMFDWFDTLEAQPTKDIVSLYEQSQNIEKQISNALASMRQMADKKKNLLQIQMKAESTKLTIEQYAEYTRVITQKVHKFQNTDKHNTLCDFPGCYSNCHVACGLRFSVNPEKIANCHAFGGIASRPNCVRCRHLLSNHHHYNSVWGLVEDTQTSVDSGAKKKYDDAKEESVREKLGMDELQNTLIRLEEGLAEATANVGDLTESYAKLSLSGSFAAQVKKSVCLLELNIETMRGNGTDEQTISAVEKSLDNMKAKLEVVEKARDQSAKKVVKPGIVKKILNKLMGK